MFSDILIYSLLVACCMALCSGLLSPFVILRSRSLFSDTISHSTLLGIGVFFFITKSASMLTALLGAALSGIFALLCIVFFKKSKISEEAILASTLATFFGGGLVVFSALAQLELSTSARLSKFLFGNLSAIWITEFYLFLVATFVVATCVLFFYSQWKIVSFDTNFAKGMFFNYSRWVFFFDAVLLVVIILGIETVGVVLMSAMLTGPAAVARQWVKSFNAYYFLSIVVAVFAALLGVIISANFSNLPPGPVIALLLALIFVFSIIKNLVSFAKKNCT